MILSLQYLVVSMQECPELSLSLKEFQVLISISILNNSRTSLEAGRSSQQITNYNHELSFDQLHYLKTN